MKQHHIKYPVILLAAIPLFTLVGCANQASVSDETEMSIAYVDLQHNENNSDTTEASSENISMTTELKKNTNGVPSASATQVTSEDDLFPYGIQTFVPGEQMIGFGFDKSEVNKQYLEVLKQNADYLSSNNQLTLQVNGHTDSMGSRVYNEWLSKQRAEAVVRLLIENGAPEDQITISANADDEPLINAKYNRDNRRVELIYQDHRMVKN